MYSSASQRNLEATKLFEGLKSRKKFLEEKLRNKLEELKELCLKEAVSHCDNKGDGDDINGNGDDDNIECRDTCNVLLTLMLGSYQELTGSTPEDLLRFFKADEIPQTRRRVGTSFMLSSKLLNNDLSQVQVRFDIYVNVVATSYQNYFISICQHRNYRHHHLHHNRRHHYHDL